MAARPAPALLLLLLLPLLLPVQTCTERTEPTDAAPTPTPDGNSSANRPLPGIELKACGPRPATGPLVLLAPLAPLALRLGLG